MKERENEYHTRELYAGRILNMKKPQADRDLVNIGSFYRCNITAHAGDNIKRSSVLSIAT